MFWLKKYWKPALVLIFTLAIFLGLSQRRADPYLNYSAKTYSFQKNPAGGKSLTEYFRETELLKKNPAVNGSTSFIAVGDIMLSRNVAQKIKDSGDPSYPFRNISQVLRSADFSFGNLESPIVGRNGIVGGHAMVFAAASSSLTGLVENKFRVLNLANNHALDQGPSGLETTADYLDRAKIQHTGAGKDQASAWQAAKVEQNGILTCFLGTSYASFNDNGNTVNAYVARMEDLNKLTSAISGLKTNCDFVVVSMHAGAEYTLRPNGQQIEFAHAAVEAGADVVIGSHPHWIQTVEKYHDKYIFYSLGNFIFDQMWSQETREGLILKIKLKKPGNRNSLQGSRATVGLESIELIPTIIDDYSAPRAADAEETKKILDKIGQTATKLLP